MKAEKPAQGILKRNDYGNSMIYQVVCDCGDDRHNHNVYVEAEDIGVTVTIYTTVKSKWWELNRWQKIWTLLTKGYVEYETNIIMNKQVALNYADVLKSAIKDCEQFQQNLKNKNEKKYEQN
jgi:hypothetical protein